MSEITILGAGIAGLATATALGQRGFDVTVYEQAGAITEVGAGLQISPNGAAVLRALGLGDALGEGGIAARAVRLMDGPGGGKVAEFDLSGRDYHFLHRKDLIEMLRRRALSTGARISLDARVTGVTQSGPGVRINFADGRSVDAPVVIGADGVHSVARAHVAAEVTPKFTGQVAWRALVPNPADAAPIAQVHMGPGRHLVHYPLAEGRLMNIVAVEERSDWVADGWATQDDPARLRAAFRDFDLPVRDLLSAVEDVHLWGLHNYPVLRRWSSGGLCLVGDAAHPMLPFLGQGANMALEDAWVLARNLAQQPTAEAFAATEAARIHRVSRVVRASRSNARNYHLRGAPRLVARTVLRGVGAVAPNFFIRTLGWLYDHDVTEGATAGDKP